MIRACAAFLALSFLPATLSAQSSTKPSKSQNSSAAKTSSPKSISASEELQHAIEDAGNDRAALVRNLEEYLKKYPQAPERPQIYRALVEATLQLRDNARAADYAERIVALSPDDMAITILAIQLLEKTGDKEAMRRAVNYSTRVLDYVNTSSTSEKSPRVSPQEWESEKKRDQMSVLLLRGRLENKLKDTAAARRDFEESYKLLPSASAASRLGELDELEKRYDDAALHYARAIALSDASAKEDSRRELLQKLGNVWRLSHGSDAGLGDFLLKSFDQVFSATNTAKPAKNAGISSALEFSLRTAPAGAPYPLSSQKGKVLVINFWATWCGPCRAMEPAYERVASRFAGDSSVQFLSANCDEDESLVAPYLQEVKPRTTTVFADGLENFFGVEAFPTIVILDRNGKVIYRADGFSEDSFDAELTAAVQKAQLP